MSFFFDQFIPALIVIVIITILGLFVVRLLPGKKTKKASETLTPTHDYTIEDLWKALNTQLVRLHEQGAYKEATVVAEEALKTAKELYGSQHLQVATSMNNLAALYKVQGNFIEAEPLYQQALTIWEKNLGKESVEVGSCLNNLAELYSSLGKYTEAENLYKKSLDILEKKLGKEHSNVVLVLENMADLYKKIGNINKAAIYQESARLIRQKTTQNP